MTTDTPPATIVEFLNARLDEDEAMAKDAALMSGWDGFGETRIASGSEWVASYHVVKRKRAEGEPLESRKGRELADCGNMNLERAKHMARQDPSRVLADVAAKRAIIHQHGNNDGGHECPDGFMDRAETEPHTGFEVVCMTQRHLASVYADHPDYREEWKP